ncbi:hypothetical protein LTR05_005072 [Lithohypha guttulata]|uniref:5-formyltetrahydrofolate cyclo-ligase n=1 Tax=Lithohypha guttulata TaxID=1690604 RepID=A0AAN7Y6C9_9EURO|nr:hypothetical protein LTR05_005072 [Lithohypha guttulata]
MASTIREEKKALRKHIKELLGKIEEENVKEQCTVIVTRKVLQLPEYQHAKSVSVFLSMPGREVSTIEIVRDALRQGKQVFIPYIHSAQDDQKHKVMDMLRLQDEQDLQSLKPDKWGIPSLSPESIDKRENALGGKGIDDSSDVSDSASILDLILMPGMAFDTAHNRLGHGKGFYDTYLSKIHRITEASGKRPRFPKLVALALQEQLLPHGEHVPTDEDDWKIDCLVVPEQIDQSS